MKTDVAVTLAIMAAAAAIYLVDPTNAWLGWNDVLYAQHNGIFAASLDWSAADIASPLRIVAKLMLLVHAIIGDPHGPLPAAYFGLFYRIAEALGIPFAPWLIQAPTALLGAAAIGLFHATLRNAGIGPRLAIAGALVVALSPLLMASGRGISTAWVVAISFDQALAIYAFQRLAAGRRHGQILVGLALAHIILADVLSFLVIAAAIVAFSLRQLEWTPVRDLPKRPLSVAVQGARPLKRKKVLVPALLAFSIPLASLVSLTPLAARIAGQVPLQPILLFWAFAAHSGELGSGQSLSMGVWLTRLLLLLGDFGPMFVVVAIVGAVISRRHLRSGFLWNYAWMASLGFGVLFFVLANIHPTTKYFDQTYLLVPITLLGTLSVDAMIRAGGARRLVGWATIGLTVLGAASGGYTFVWRVPLSPFANRTMISEKRPDVIDNVMGIRRPHYGHRAAGYIVRTRLLRALKQGGLKDMSLVFDVSPAVPARYEYGIPLLDYAGLFQNADWFRAVSGRAPEGAIYTIEPTPSDAAKACNGASMCFAEQSISSHAVRWVSREDVDVAQCPLTYCVTVRADASAGAAPPPAIYRIFDGPHLRGRVTMIGFATDDLPPGDYEAAVLEAKFTHEFHSLWDYLPKRPVDRLAAMLRRIIDVGEQR